MLNKNAPSNITTAPGTNQQQQGGSSDQGSILKNIHPHIFQKNFKKFLKKESKNLLYTF